VTLTHVLRLSARSVAGGIVLLVLAAVPVLAHAELVSSDPAAGATTVTGSIDQIVAVFDEPLEDNSSMLLNAPGGGRPASGGVDPADRTRMVIDLIKPLEPGAYEVRWVAASADGHVERGSFTFTVVAPTPSPTVAPTTEPSATPNPTVSPTVSPSPSGNGTRAGATADVIFPLLAAVIAIAALAAFILNRNRRAARR
jgi:copper resistance protein C